MIVSTDAIIIKSKKYGDTSKLIVAFTRHYGRVSLIAKGARRSKNKFGDALEALSCSYLSFYMKQGRDLFLLSNAEPQVSLRKLRESFTHLSAGLIIAETVMHTKQAGEEDEELYKLVLDALTALNNRGNYPYSILAWYMIEFIYHNGFALAPAGLGPILQEGASEIYLDIENGVFANSPMGGRYFRLHRGLAEKLLAVSAFGPEVFGDIKVNDDEKSEMLRMFMSYMSFHLEKHFSLKTFNLLR